MKNPRPWMLPVAAVALLVVVFAAIASRGSREAQPPEALDASATTGTATLSDEATSESAPMDAPSSSAELDGPMAIPFTATTITGTTVSLSDYKGKVLLLDFWASWCPPCRAEAPNVVRVYNKYRSQGFDILGVSLDREKAPMHAFMQEVGMTWPEVYDKDNNYALAAMYNVESIPAMLLIDGTTGRVLAENPRGPALEEAVAEAVARLAP